MGHADWRRVTHEHSCPICGKPDWCRIGTRFIHCMRVQNDRPCPAGGWLHPTGADPQAPLPPRPKRTTDRELDDIWRPIANQAILDGRPWLGVLAKNLGVPPEALRSLLVGHAEHHGTAWWTIPERNEHGMVVGIQRRYLDGRKQAYPGSRRGLVYDDQWAKREGPIFLVEGMSDVAACLAMGLTAIGRPSNTGGVDMLTRMLRQTDRRIIVVGERDAKPKETIRVPDHPDDCPGCPNCYPGRYGMVKTAVSLAKGLRRSVRCQMPPGRHKDARVFWLHCLKHGLTPDEAKDLWLHGRRKYATLPHS